MSTGTSQVNWDWFDILLPWKQKKQPTTYQERKQVRHTTKGGKGKVAKALEKAKP